MTKEEFMRDIGSKIPPARPDTEQQFREFCIRNKFLLYDGKKNRCVCTNCGGGFDIAPGEYSHMHGQRDVCPSCESKVTCLSAGRGRACYEERHRLLTFASDGESLWVVSNDILVRFDDFAKAQIYIHCNEVFKINAEEQRHWRYKDGWFSYPPYWDELKSLNVAPLPAAPYCCSKYEMHVFTEGIEEILKNSDCRFLIGKDLRHELQWPSGITWIALQMKYPALELLRKGGFDKLARERLTLGFNYQGAVNIRARTIEKALRISKKWVKAFRRAGISKELSSRELKSFQQADEKKKQFIIDNFEAWSDLIHRHRAEESVKVIETVTTLEKYMKYMTKQGQSDVILYEDYLRSARALGWDLSRKSIMFPKDLKAAHDEAAELLEIEKNSEIDKRISAHAVDIEYRTDDLAIICAKSQGELNEESRVLHHCVRTYGEKVASGRTLIYFVRKTSEINLPYYTLEIDPLTGKVIQCRGEHNRSMTPEVEAFRNGFEKTFQNMLKKGATACQTA